MQKFGTLFGTMVWMALSLVMVFAALEPVELRSQPAKLANATLAACASDAGHVSVLCETNTL